MSEKNEGAGRRLPKKLDSRRYNLTMNLIPRSAALLLLIALTSQISFACLNDGTPVVTFGEYIDMKGSVEDFMTRFRSRQDENGYIFKGEGRMTSPVPGAADLHASVMLVREGRYQEAIEKLEIRESLQPGKYEVASNLGTAYELIGDNERALQWIRVGMHRNPESHFGTEWLHVKILEAKIALAKDPDWLKRNTVLGLDPEKLSSESFIEFEGRRINIAEIEKALVYQLHERMFFVKAPEAVVGDLLVDLGRVLKITRSAAHSAAVNQLAVEYGAVLDRKIEKPADMKSMISIYAGGAAIILVILGIFAFFIRRKDAPETISLNE